MKELVALRYPNRQFAVRLATLWDDGFAVLPMSPTLPDAQVELLLQQFKPSGIEDLPGFTRLDDGIPVDDEIALVLPTSGTSGPPKGVELSHRALGWSAQAVNRRLEANGQRWLVCLPLSHIAGIGILVRSALAGTEPVIHDRFDLAAVAAETETSLISLVPTTLKRLLDAEVDLSRYHAVLVGGGPVPASLIERAHRLGVPAIRTYGMTETCGGCIYDGFPLQGVEMRVEDEQVLLKGPMLMDGYRLQPQLSHRSLAGGWFRTSDLGHVDASGRLEILGRADDVIITGGEKVAPGEVEDLLREHEQVADAAVVALPDPEWGQAVGAVIVPAGPTPPTLEELRGWVSGRGASYMAPKRVAVIAEIPRNEAGKPDRSELRRLFDPPPES